VAYPRRQPPADEDLAAQGRMAVTLTETEVVHLAASPDGYRLGIPVETRTYELRGLGAPEGYFSLEAMILVVAAADPHPKGYDEGLEAVPDKRLIERVRIQYCDRTALHAPLPFGTVDLLALPYESYLLALTPGQIAARFNTGQERVTPA